MTLEVIGAGFGRTGTRSLQAALEYLGFKPCDHMQAVMLRPWRIRAWLQISRGRSPDWQRFFRGYRAAVDWPVCTYYRELLAAYPAAKVILTVRDPARWYESAYNSVYLTTRAIPGWFWVVPGLGYAPRLLYSAVWEGTFHGRFTERAYALKIYKRHLASVQRHVPPEKLLIYRVSEGWEPLCRFLGVPVPAGIPFPHLNETNRFRRFRLGLGLLRYLLWVLLGVVVGWELIRRR